MPGWSTSEHQRGARARAGERVEPRPQRRTHPVLPVRVVDQDAAGEVGPRPHVLGGGAQDHVHARAAALAQDPHRVLHQGAAPVFEQRLRPAAEPAPAARREQQPGDLRSVVLGQSWLLHTARAGVAGGVPVHRAESSGRTVARPRLRGVYWPAAPGV